MLVRLFVPLIVLIMLKNLEELSLVAKLVSDDLRLSYETLVCGRYLAYVENINDAQRFLSQEWGRDMSVPQSNIDEARFERCFETSISIYREVNEDLPLHYPNWVYRGNYE